MGTQIGIPYFKYSFQYGGGGGALEEHNHSTLEQGGAVPLTSITGHSKAIHDALAILHSSLTGIGIDNHHPKIHKAEHESGGGDSIDHNALVNYLASQHKTLPNTIAQVLSDHNKALHDALNINADTVDNKHLPNTIAQILSNHNKAVHEALGIDADTVDGEHAAGIVTNTRIMNFFPKPYGLIIQSIPGCRVRRVGDQDIPHDVLTKVNLNSKVDGWDILNNWSTVNSEFTVPAGHAGRYLFIFVCEFEQMSKDPTDTSDVIGCKFKINGAYQKGSTFGRYLTIHADAVIGTQSLQTLCFMDLDVNDVVTVHVSQANDDEAVRPISGDPAYTFLCVQKLIDP